MKPHTHPSFSLTGRALLASAVVSLVGVTAALAQSSSNSGSNSPTNDRYNSSSPSSTNSSHDMNSMSNTSSDTSATTTADTDSSTRHSMSSHSGSKLGWSDRHFITKAADGNQAEVQVAQLAVQRASSPEVKDFAQKLVDDHTKVVNQLTELASQKNVKLDQDDSKDRTYRRLSKASGSDFDREFVEYMADDHEKDIKMFEKEAKDAKDPELKAFAEQSLPTLREHLQMVQNLRETTTPTGRTDKTSGRGNMNTSSGKTTTTTGAIDNGTTGSATSSSSGTSSSDDKRGGK